jgi:hypothetical protein
MMSPGHSLTRFYQQHQASLNQAIVSGGLACVFTWFAVKMAVYPPEWQLTLTVTIFLVGWRWPEWGYAVFVAALALPLRQISIYVAALGLAILILPARWVVRHLGAALLILITPAVAPWHLALLVPPVAGLWWSERKGATVSGIAAFWLKLCAGMASQPVDLNELSGHSLSLASIQDRFADANSLQTLQRLAEPFSEQLLLHILQCLLWIVVGYIVARTQQRLKHWRVLGPMSSVALGGGMMVAGLLSLTAWLNPSDLALDANAGQRWGSFFLAVLIAGGVYQSWQYLQRPQISRPLPVARHPALFSSQGSPGPDGSTRPDLIPESETWLRQVKPQPAIDEEDVILIELDTIDPSEQDQSER